MDEPLYLVPKMGLDWAALEQAMRGLGAVEQEPEPGYALAWSLDGTTIRLFEDAALHVEQLEVVGSRSSQVADAIAERVSVYSPEDMPTLFAAVGDDDAELDAAIAVLAVVAPGSADPSLVRLFEVGFRHPDPMIREGAVIAAAVPRWPELRVAVEQLAESDPDDEVRTTAAVVLADFDRLSR